MTGIKKMLVAQWEMQRDAFGADPTAMSNEEAIAFIHWNVTALVDELHEMLAEIGWKPWASSRHIHGAEAAKEMVDAWHFFMNILLALGPHIAPPNHPGAPGPHSVPDLAHWFENAYFAKHEVNRQRQLDGYDGLTTKCSACKRELSEVNPDNPTCGLPEGCPYFGA